MVSCSVPATSTYQMVIPTATSQDLELVHITTLRVNFKLCRITLNMALSSESWIVVVTSFPPKDRTNSIRLLQKAVSA